MNYTPDVGWFYISLNKRSAAWSGVPYLYNFITKNSQKGPYGKEVPISLVEAGDIIQLKFDGSVFGHSLFVVETGKAKTPQNILVATHTFDADYRPLSSYLYKEHRFIHIEGFY